MSNTSEKLEKMLGSNLVKDNEKLKKQQEYYRKLSNKGLTQKQTYNLKPISSI